MTPQLSLAAFPGLHTWDAARQGVDAATSGALREPMFARIGVDHVQLVPQNFGVIEEDLVDALRSSFPNTSFRLHANARVLWRTCMADLANMSEHLAWWEQAARISKSLKAPAYSAHSGLRRDASLSGMLDNARRAADLFECPVAIEGQYPAAEDWLIASWHEYRLLMDSGVPYALDLSHLNILVSASGAREDTLVAEMLACERCIEVHVSDNDGRGDQHRICSREAWWMPLLKHVHAQAVVFTEGNHRRPALVTSD